MKKLTTSLGLSLLLGLLILLCISTSLFAQSPSSDLSLVEKEDFHQHEFDKREVRFMGADSKSPFVKYNPLTLVFGTLMFTYQQFISPQISADCYYGPSCSHFSKEAIKEFGIIKGVFLSADRLSRCNRVAAMDIPYWDIDPELHRAIDPPKKYRVRQ